MISVEVVELPSSFTTHCGGPGRGKRNDGNVIMVPEVRLTVVTMIVEMVQWGRRALAAYTWFRTEKGPQRQWLHKIAIGKVEDPSCPCGAPVQSGEHIIWHCSAHRYERAKNRISSATRAGEWADLDGKIWVPNEEAGDDGEDNQVDGIERFFDYLAYQF